MAKDLSSVNQEAMSKEVTSTKQKDEQKQEAIYYFRFVRPPHKWSRVPEHKLIFILRRPRTNKLSPTTRKHMKSLRLWIPHAGVFAKADEAIMVKLRELRPYLTYGHLIFSTIRSLIHSLGAVKVGGEIMGLAENPSLVEQIFGQYNIFSLDDVVKEIASVGPHFNEVSNTLLPFYLDEPESPKGGADAGDLEEAIGKIAMTSGPGSSNN